MQLTYADMAAAECVRRLRDRADLEFALLHTGRRLEEDPDREGEKFQDSYPCLWSLQEWVFSSVEGIRNRPRPINWRFQTCIKLDPECSRSECKFGTQIHESNSSNLIGRLLGHILANWTKRMRSDPQEVAVPPPAAGGRDPAEVRAPRPRLGQKVCAGKARPLGFLVSDNLCASYVNSK